MRVMFNFVAVRLFWYTNVKMIYIKQHIDLLKASLEGDNKATEILLGLNKNLGILSAALKGDIKAIEWLAANDAILAIFVNATQGNKSAIRFLLDKSEAVLAATANMVLGDKKAEEWLVAQDLEHYVFCAEAIKYAKKNIVD